MYQQTSMGTALFLLGGSVMMAGSTPPLLAQEVNRPTYQAATAGTRILEAESGLSIKMLVEASNLGGNEVEIGEITFPAGAGTQPNRGHLHQSTEIFYILSGRFDHIVNGQSYVLEPGMVGIVRPGDRVVHRVLSDEPVKALVIWAPGGEAARIARFLTSKPID